MTTQTVAVLFGIKGGLSDVGKFAVEHALKMSGVKVRPVALSLENEEGSDYTIDADIADKQALAQLKQAFSGVKYTRLNIGDDSAQSKLEEVLDGCDAVVSCLGNRQNHAIWCNLGAQKLVAAMQARKVHRLVQLSSMGIGDDYLPMSPIKALWWCMLRTSNKSSYKDLVAMEATVLSSELDFVLVRPMGIDPDEKPQGSWKILQRRGEGKLPITVAKQDVALFMLTEAIKPSLHQQCITIGKNPPTKK